MGRVRVLEQNPPSRSGLCCATAHTLRICTINFVTSMMRKRSKKFIIVFAVWVFRKD